MRWEDIPQLTSWGSYEVQYGLFEDFIRHIESEEAEYYLELNPDFQRGHVWTEQQQVSYIEYVISGGKTGTILLNAYDWPQVKKRGDYVCVDGLQRITAIKKFYHNEIKAFSHYYSEFEGKLPFLKYSIPVNVNNLKTREEVLKWYIELNSGGTPHTVEEIEKVRDLLRKEKENNK